ncbi:uncharacterized protein LOC125956453 [Anopheles darlingi]|uniref:uncharacterized protein LOC125956453 n=1 Tax=Anopheles darlingi TaxID=43151 RepID=UPI0021002542|nr:uncharacterized protein LOC125956453 [Anopheles darlingi]
MASSKWRSSWKRPGSNKKEHQDSLKTKSNLTGLKHALHGTSYQLKLGIVVSLANVKKTLVSTEKYSFTVTAEDPTAGKFDDIVYAFQDGNKTGTLKIQSKHKLSSSPCKSGLQDGNSSAKEIHVQHKQESSIPKITLNDLIADSKNDFFIQQYFKSYRDQPQGAIKNDVEGLIICTNADLDDDAKVMWNEIDAAVLTDSTTSLDSYISSLFDKAGEPGNPFLVS